MASSPPSPSPGSVPSMMHAVHSLLEAGDESRHPPMALIRDDTLWLIGIAECSGRGADALAAANIVLDAIRTHLTLFQDVIHRFHQQPTDLLRADIITNLKEAVVRAGREAFALQRRKKVPLGVGVDLVLLGEREGFAAHVGYGQMYLLRRELLHRLTLTSPGMDGAMVPASVGSKPDARQPLALLGMEPAVHVETLVLTFSSGDRLLIGSSCLAAALDDATIREQASAIAPVQALQDLVAAARERRRGEPVGALVYQVPGEVVVTRTATNNRLAALGRMPLFAFCSPEELAVVASITQNRKVPRFSMVFEQGAPGQEVYLILSGEVVVVRDGAQVARLGPSQSFGEMSLLDESVRSATAVASADTELMVIGKEAFFGLLRGNPTLAVKILWNLLLRLSENLRTTTNRVAELQAQLQAAQRNAPRDLGMAPRQP